MLESYNYEYAQAIGLHPNLFSFVELLDKEMNRWVMRLEQARKGTFVSRQKRKEIEWPTIPHDFEAFVEANAAKFFKKTK